MISYAEMQLDAPYPEQFLPKISFESGILIKKNRMRHVMKLEDMVHENLSHSGGGKLALKSTKIIILGKMINNHHDD
jgi:hypothetical protein